MEAKDRPYPEEHARRLLNDITGRHPRHTNQRVEAAHQLLKQFAELALEYGLRIRTEDRDTLKILQARSETHLLIRRNPGWIFITTESGDNEPGLIYNPQTHLFEGAEYDPDIAPKPGMLRPRLSALAVLVREILKHIPEASL